MGQMLTDVNGETDSNTIRVGNFNKPLQQWTDHSDKKISKETQAICGNIRPYELINKTFHLKEAEYVFFSCGTFSKTEYMLHHKASLSIFKKIGGNHNKYLFQTQCFEIRNQLQGRKLQKAQTHGGKQCATKQPVDH